MAGAHASEDEEKPLDPAVENVRRKLLRFMAINLGLLFAALMIVVAAIVYKSMTAEPAPPVAGLTPPADGGMIEGTIPLPAGARIVSQSLSGERLTLHVEEPGGQSSIYLYNLAARRLAGRFSIETGK